MYFVLEKCHFVKVSALLKKIMIKFILLNRILKEILMKIVVCDDDVNFCKLLTQKLISYGGADTIKYFNNAFALVTYICDVARGDVDVLYINVKLGMDSGIEVAADLQGVYSSLKVIFMSESNDCADMIFAANPSFFILKDGPEVYMEEAYRRISILVNEDLHRMLTVKIKGSIIKIPFNKIYYMENSGHKIIFYTDESSYESVLNMNSLLELLPPKFIQCHRSYVINTDKIKRMNADRLELTNGMQVPLSKTYCKNVKEILHSECISCV